MGLIGLMFIFTELTSFVALRPWPLRATAQALSDFAEKVVDAAAQDAEISSLKERLAAAEAQAEEKLRHQNEKHDTDLQHKEALARSCNYCTPTPTPSPLYRARREVKRWWGAVSTARFTDSIPTGDSEIHQQHSNW
ncbi:hypothetical protein V500_03964 [Pseudogymnoascus sp. VKM F-4518 (FW-2643)]|nr:hypothetical protein V500_03964 [Pseudogymnoascus sp. VKM F-4518 (FW-2643)]